jgi:hypothetical protein
MMDSTQGLRPDGRLVAMGADAEPLSISLTDLIMKRIRVIGSQQNGPGYLCEAPDFVAQGSVKTIVETYRDRLQICFAHGESSDNEAADGQCPQCKSPNAKAPKALAPIAARPMVNCRRFLVCVIGNYPT